MKHTIHYSRLAHIFDEDMFSSLCNYLQSQVHRAPRLPLKERHIGGSPGRTTATTQVRHFYHLFWLIQEYLKSTMISDRIGLVNNGTFD